MPYPREFRDDVVAVDLNADDPEFGYQLIADDEMVEERYGVNRPAGP